MTAGIVQSLVLTPPRGFAPGILQHRLSGAFFFWFSNGFLFFPFTEDEVWKKQKKTVTISARIEPRIDLNLYNIDNKSKKT